MSKHKCSYAVIGTASSPATLTDDLTDNTDIICTKLMDTLTVNGGYTPLTGQTDRVAFIIVEVSNDGGTTYEPWSLRANTTVESDVYVENATLSDANQIPFKVPGDGTSTGNTEYKFQFTIDIDADFVRISAEEDGSANFGTLYARATVTEKE